MKFFLALFCVVTLAVVSQASINYNGYRIYRLKLSSAQQFNEVYYLRHEYKFNAQFTLLHEDKAGLEVDVMVSPDFNEYFGNYMTSIGIKFELLSQNVMA